MSTTAPVTVTDQNTPVTPVSEVKRRALELRQQKVSYREIAKQLNVSHMTVKRWASEDVTRNANSLGVSVTTVTRQDIQKRIFEAAPGALQTVVSLSTDCPKPEIKLNASRDLLDRAGFAPATKILNVHAVEEMTRDQLLSGIMSMITGVNCNGSELPSSNMGVNCNSNTDMGTDTNMGISSMTSTPACACNDTGSAPASCAHVEEGDVAATASSGGSPQATSDQNSSCKCNHPHTESDRFCSQCGEKLEDGREK